MDFRKSILYFVLAILGIMLFHAWQHDYPSVQPASSQAAAAAQHPIDFAPT